MHTDEVYSEVQRYFFHFNGRNLLLPMVSAEAGHYSPLISDCIMRRAIPHQRASKTIKTVHCMQWYAPEEYLCSISEFGTKVSHAMYNVDRTASRVWHIHLQTRTLEIVWPMIAVMTYPVQLHKKCNTEERLTMFQGAALLCSGNVFHVKMSKI